MALWDGRHGVKYNCNSYVIALIFTDGSDVFANKDSEATDIVYYIRQTLTKSNSWKLLDYRPMFTFIESESNRCKNLNIWGQGEESAFW